MGALNKHGREELSPASQSSKNHIEIQRGDFYSTACLPARLQLYSAHHTVIFLPSCSLRHTVTDDYPASLPRGAMNGWME